MTRRRRIAWSCAEAADMLGVSESTVKRAVAAGHVRTASIGLGTHRALVRIPDIELRRVARDGIGPRAQARAGGP